jgi:hypothetical protein
MLFTIVTGIRGGQLSIPDYIPVDARYWFLSKTSEPTLMLTPSPIQCEAGGGDCSAGIKWLGRDADHSPFSSAKIMYCKL